MNLAILLQFIPLAIGLLVAYHLIMKEGLPNQSLGKILSYFVGILIVFAATSWLINSFFASWANGLLQTATTSTELQSLINTSGGIIDNAFSGEAGSGVNNVPVSGQTQQTNDTSNTAIIVVTATPNVMNANPQTLPGSDNQDQSPQSGPIEHTVVQGDTLFGIAGRYGSTVNDIMIQNGLTSYIIRPGDKLTIPAASQ